MDKCHAELHSNFELKIRTPPPLPDTVDFDWEQIEPSEKPDAYATEVFASTLHWLISFCISNPRFKKSKKSENGRANLKTGYRRFLALVYVYRPDLLDGRTIAALAEDLNVSRQEINKYISDVSLEFKYQGPNQRTEANRIMHHAAQLRKIAEKNTKRKRKSISTENKNKIIEKNKKTNGSALSRPKRRQYRPKK